MFKVVAESRKRPFWTSRTVAASVVFHLLLLAGFVSAAENNTPERVEVGFIDVTPPDPPRPVRVEPTPPAPQPDKPQPVKGATLQLPAPDKVPDTLPAPDPDATPITEAMVTGIGPVGDVIGTPAPTPAPPTGSTEPQNLPSWDAPIDASSADTQPELANKRQAEMALQRAYPPRLRDVGVAGHTTVMLIIDKDGNVEPGSVQVQESTHDAFKEASVRAVERFHFKPATLRGHPVAVLVTLPIAWELQN
jgi:protein TonB